MDQVEGFIKTLQKTRVSPGWYDNDEFFHFSFSKNTGWRWTFTKYELLSQQQIATYYTMLETQSCQYNGFKTRKDAFECASMTVESLFGLKVQTTGFSSVLGREYSAKEKGRKVRFSNISKLGWTVVRDLEEQTAKQGHYGPKENTKVECLVAGNWIQWDLNEKEPSTRYKSLRKAVAAYLEAS